MLYTIYIHYMWGVRKQARIPARACLEGVSYDVGFMLRAKEWYGSEPRTRRRYGLTASNGTTTAMCAPAVG